MPPGWAGERAGGTTVDIKTLQEMHLRWKGRLTRFLDGQEDLDPDKLASPDQCDLGKWLNSPGVRPFAKRPEYSSLIQLHNEMHALVKEVVVLHHSGKCTEALASVPLVGKLSNEVVAALSGLERTLEQSEMVNIVVLQADGRRFGLIVDGINDTEEIVVKPLGKQLKGVSLFAGATIMGDGRVSLILDVAGTAQRGGGVGNDRSAGAKKPPGNRIKEMSARPTSCSSMVPTARWRSPCPWWPGSKKYPAPRSNTREATKWSSTAARSFPSCVCPRL